MSIAALVDKDTKLVINVIVWSEGDVLDPYWNPYDLILCDPSSNYPTTGMLYSEEHNKFAWPKPEEFPSWILKINEFDDLVWQPPVEMPNDGYMYEWSEEQQNWIKPTIDINLTNGKTPDEVLQDIINTTL